MVRLRWWGIVCGVAAVLAVPVQAWAAGHVAGGQSVNKEVRATEYGVGAYTAPTRIASVTGSAYGAEASALWPQAAADTKPFDIAVVAPANQDVVASSTRVSYQAAQNGPSAARTAAAVSITSTSVSVIDSEGTDYPLFHKPAAGADEKIDLTPFEGQTVQLVISAVDTQHRTVSVKRILYVESSSYLHRTEQTSGRIVDIDGRRLLIQGEDGALRLRQTGTAAETTIREAGGGEVLEPRLTDVGAVFWGVDAEAALYLWKEGKLARVPVPLTPAQYAVPGSLRTAGSLAAFATASPNRGYLVNTQTGAWLEIPATFVTGVDLRANGDVYFTGDGLYKYRWGGTPEKLAASAATVFGPVSDDSGVLYSTGSAIYKYQAGKADLVSAKTTDARAFSAYRAYGGWTAYLKQDATKANQLYLRSPSGADTAVTNAQWPWNKQIEAVSGDGSVLFLYQNQRYFYTPGAKEPVRISSALGEARHLDGTLYETLGNALFRLLIGPAPDTAPPVWPAGSALSVTDVTYRSARLSWPAATDNVGVTRYSVYSGSELLGQVNAAAGFDAQGLRPSTTYTFTVKAEDAAGNQSASGLSATVTTPAQPPVRDTESPKWPSGGNLLSVTDVTYGSARLQWKLATDNVGVTEYRVYRDNTLVGTVAGSVYQYTDTALKPGVTYRFTVEARDAVGNVSGANPSVTVTTPAKPVPPAASGAAIRVKPGFIDVGSSIELTLQAEQADDLYAYLLKLRYDQEKVKLRSVALHSDFGLAGTTAVLSKDTRTPGVLNVAGALLGPVSGRTGQPGLAVLTFVAQQPGRTTLTLTPESSFASSRGVIHSLPQPVELALWIGDADVDGNGRVDLNDVVQVSRKLGSKAGDPDFEASLDLNADGRIDKADVQRVNDQATQRI